MLLTKKLQYRMDLKTCKESITKASSILLNKIFVAIFMTSLLTLLIVIAHAISIPVCVLLPAPLYPLTYFSYLSRAVIHPILEAVMTREIRTVLLNCLPIKLLCCGKTNEKKQDQDA